MEDAMRGARLPFARSRRADEIGAHERHDVQNIVLIALIVLFALALLALGFYQHARASRLELPAEHPQSVVSGFSRT